MRKILLVFVLLLLAHSLARAQLINRTFVDVPLPEALKSIANESDDYVINFQYNDIEDFMVTTSVRSKSVVDAIKQVVGFYPVRVKVDRLNKIITLECTNRAHNKYKGVVKNEMGNPLEYANVLCMYPADSSFIAGGVSNESGVFVIPCECEDVLLKVSYVGYDTKCVRCRKSDMGTITLHETIQKLAPVTISGRRMQMDDGGYSLNLNVRDLQTSDVLTYLPNLSVINNTYCINGQEAEVIYINGQEVVSPNELCNLPSEMVSNVKVDYRSRTINILLRSPESGGFNGSINAGCDFHNDEGLYDRAAGGVWYSRYKGFSLYDKFDYDYYDLSESVEQMQSTAHSTSTVDGELNPKRTQLSNRFSITQELNDNHTLAASYYFASNRLKAIATMNRTEYLNATRYEGSNQYVDQEGTVRYTALIGRRKATLNAVADLYSRETSSENLSLYGAGVGTENAESPSIRLWKFMVDAKIPLPKYLELKCGSDFRFFYSNYDPDNFISNFHGGPAFTYKMQHYGYTERAFAELNANWQKWKWGVGYDAKYNLSLQSIEEKETEGLSDLLPDGDYLQFVFGTHANVSYQFGSAAQHIVYLNYRHQLDDIPYAVMSPFIRWSDAYNYSLGNPELRSPRRFDLTAGLSLWNSKLNLSAHYSKMEDEIYWQTSLSQGQTNVFYTVPINVAKSQQFGAYVELNVRPFHFWRMKLDGQLTVRPEDAVIGGQNYDATRLQQHYSIANTIQFCSSWSASLKAHCTPKYTMYDRTYLTHYEVSGDVSKSFFRGKLQCKLTFTALGNRRRLERQVGDMKVSYSYTLPVQSAGIHLVWKFSQGKTKNSSSIVDGEQKYKELNDK